MPRRLLKPERLGYRGASLLMYGLIFFLVGLPLVLGIAEVEPVKRPITIGLPIWAGGFVAAGVIAIIAAFKRSPASDKIGFVSLSVVGNSWVAFNIALQIAHTFWPHISVVGGWGAWLSIIANTAIMIKVWIDSGWNEPTEPLYLERRGRT